MSEPALGATWRPGGDCGFLCGPRARQVLESEAEGGTIDLPGPRALLYLAER